jgi:hypothetical protein
MKSALINNATLLLLPGQQNKYFNDNSNGKNETRHLWMMSSHTHKYGTYFDIFKKDNSKPNQIGDTLYKGNIDYTSNFDKGFYDWEHTSVKYFSPQVPVNMKTEGIRIYTEWNITQSTPVTFGFTTKDEMQLFYYMYTNSLPGTNTGIETISNADNLNSMAVYPNPFNNKANLLLNAQENDDLNVLISDIQGKTIFTQKAKIQKGENTIELNGLPANLSAGTYLIKAVGTNFSENRKLIVE